jgi:putative Holliday junction resolvase
MARLLALDVGDVRIGVAVSDASGFLASPYTTLRVSRDETQTWREIQHILDETEAEGIVVGLPVSLDGQLHAQGQRVRDFAMRLQEHIHVPLVFWDERYSTVEAERLRRLRAERSQDASGKMGRQRKYSRQGRQGRQGKRGRQRKQHEIDAEAAAVILQEYLDESRLQRG